MEKNIPLTEALFYILLAVRKPNHGYGIIQDVSALTNGRVVLGAGTLYGAIQTLVKKQWIAIYSEDTDSRKKKGISYYQSRNRSFSGGESPSGGTVTKRGADG